MSRPGLALGLGLGLASFEGVGGPQIVLSNSYISELSSNPTAVGTLSVVGGTGVWTFSELLDADNKFGVTGSTLNKTASVAYDTKSSHVVTIRATNGTDTIDRVMTIFVMAVPAQIGSGDWSVADLGTNGDALITISVAPNAKNSAITAYQYQVGAGAWTTLGSAIGAYPISGLTDGSAVNIGVRAVNAIGNGTGSATKSVTSTGIPDAFFDANWSIAGADGKATVTVASNPANNGSAITAIQYSKDSGAWTNSGISGPGSFDISGTNGVLMSVRLRAVNVNGPGPNGNAETATPSVVVTINAPTMVTVVEPIANPPSFVMLSDWVAPDEVQIGDTPHVRIDEDNGQVYDGTPVSAPDENPSGFSVPPLSAGTHDFEFWYSRPGVVGAKSTPVEVDIESSETTVFEDLFDTDTSISYGGPPNLSVSGGDLLLAAGSGYSEAYRQFDTLLTIGHDYRFEWSTSGSNENLHLGSSPFGSQYFDSGPVAPGLGKSTTFTATTTMLAVYFQNMTGSGGPALHYQYFRVVDLG